MLIYIFKSYVLSHFFPIMKQIVIDLYHYKSIDNSGMAVIINKKKKCHHSVNSKYFI